jgi:nucleoside-diphosphate-sugar epimerase
MIILVTGSAVFWGRHLCGKLLSNPLNQVICLDNLITGKELNIEEFKSNPNFKFINFDITGQFNLKIDHIDQIYNLASLASPDKYKEYPIKTIMVNFMSTKNVLDLAQGHNSKVFLTFASEVYIYLNTSST